jgi:hypothetical protein
MTPLSFPLLFADAEFNNLAAGQQSPRVPLTLNLFSAPAEEACYIPTPSSRPRGSIEISRIYLPAFVIYIGSLEDGDPPAAVANLQLLLIDGFGTIFWGWQDSIPLVPDSDGVESSGNVVVAVDLINPIRIDPEDSPILYTTVVLDTTSSTSQTLLGVGGGSADPANPLATLSSQPGSAFYSIPDQ